jgi:hypothetical protein
MSGEGSCCSNADYSAWGFSPGKFPVSCIDCPPDQRAEDKILGSVSSMRCLFHAIKAKSEHGRHDEGCTFKFYEPTPIDLEAVVVEVGAWAYLCVLGFLVAVVGGAVYGSIIPTA